MSRVARVVAVEYPHHITQRGNNRQDIFSDDFDRRKYLSLIASHSSYYKLEILGYCLMQNHVHFIAVPHTEESLAKTFNFAHMRYSQYFNEKMKRCGHLWQGRFYSCILDEKHLYACARYVERNPVRAGIVNNTWEYEWSSAKVHCGLMHEDILNTNRLFNYIDDNNDNEKWKSFIGGMDDSSDTNRIKKFTMRGLPVGDEQFIAALEKKLGRGLTVVPRGRPRRGK